MTSLTELMQNAVNHIDKQSEGQDEALKLIGQYIIEELIKNDIVAEKILKADLKLDKCYGKIKENARKKAVNGCACVSHTTVYAWVREYYGIEKEDLNEMKSSSNILDFNVFADL